MDWLADVCILRRHGASAVNWQVRGIVLGLRLGLRDGYWPIGGGRALPKGR